MNNFVKKQVMRNFLFAIIFLLLSGACRSSRDVRKNATTKAATASEWNDEFKSTDRSKNDITAAKQADSTSAKTDSTWNRKTKIVEVFNNGVIQSRTTTTDESGTKRKAETNNRTASKLTDKTKNDKTVEGKSRGKEKSKTEDKSKSDYKSETQSTVTQDIISVVLIAALIFGLIIYLKKQFFKTPLG